jgi:hypothetical protein
LANSTITVRVYNTTSALVSEQTYSSPNNGTGTYLGNYSIPSNAPVGTWKITTYEIGGVNTATYFTVS